MTTVEFGILLCDGVVAPAASRQAARDYGPLPGRVVVAREVYVTRIPHSGDAAVDFGEWHVDKLGTAA